MAGAILSAIGFPGIATIIYVESRGLRLIQYEPTWYVLQRVSVSVADRSGADHLDELERRIIARSLQPAELTQAVLTLLDYQANPALPWDPQIGMLLEQLNSAGSVRGPDWTNYMFNSVAAELKVRQRTHMSDPIAAAIRLHLARVGSWSGTAGITVDSVTIDGQTIPVAAQGTDELDRRKPMQIPFKVSNPTVAGEHEMIVQYTLTLNPGIGISSVGQVSKSFTLKQNFEIDDKEPTLRRHVDNVARRRAMTSGQYPWQEGASPPRTMRQPDGTLRINFRFTTENPLPYTLAYDAYLVGNNFEQLIGGFSWNSATTPWMSINLPWPGFSGHVVLRPSKDRAISDIEATGWLDTEFIFPQLQLPGR